VSRPALLRIAAAAAAATALLAARTGPAVAQDAPDETRTSVSVGVDQALAIALPSPAKTIFVANPAVADVQAHDPSRMLVLGRKPGATTIYVTDYRGAVVAYAVRVQRQAAAAAEAVAARAPRARVRLSPTPKGLDVAGEVATPREAAAVKAAASDFLDEKETLNFGVGVTGDTQVNLQVRIVEVSRQVSNSLGFNWNSLSNNGSTIVALATGRPFLSAAGEANPFTRNSALNPANSLAFGYRSPGGTTNVNGIIDALQTEGLVSILAQPNLTAASGETASFLAGGEFPVPVAQDNDAISIEWKKFGVALDFTPVVLDPGRLSIKVRPEVSELSDQGAVTINSIKVPSITVRRAETTIQLASGQSFAIAGLFQNNLSSSVNQFPWLADLPVIGQLLRSTSYTHNQSELVIIVTPYIVRPVDRPGALHTPADGVLVASDLEQIIFGRTGNLGPDRLHLKGPAGFMLEDKP
jgi:pilus assembly protein CpaC